MVVDQNDGRILVDDLLSEALAYRLRLQIEFKFDVIKNYKGTRQSNY